MGAPEAPFQPMQLTVALDEARQQQLAAAQSVVEEANGLEIDSPPMAEYANTLLRDVKERKTRIQAMHDDIVGPIRLALNNAMKWFKPSLESFDVAEGIIKRKLQDFARKEGERIAELERARKAAERAAREEAERQAAAARARAEEAARQEREKSAAAEAERKRLEEAAAKARAEGDAKAAAEADRQAKAKAAEAAQRDERERQQREAAEREAERILMDAAARAQAAAKTVHTATKIAGFTQRKNWIAELDDDTTEVQAVEKIVCAIAGVDKLPEARKDLLALLALDMKSARARAKALEERFSVPGMRARNNPIASSKGT